MTAAIVLAAGASTRLGSPKQLVQLDGERLVHRAARLALEAGCSRVIVVEGAVSLHEALAGLSVEIVHCADWAVGMGASLRRGLAHVGAAVDAALIMLVDQTQLTVDDLRALLAAPGAVAAAEYDGILGVPARFSSAHFDELRALAPDEGARRWLAENQRLVTRVPMDHARIDVDRPADLPR